MSYVVGRALHFIHYCKNSVITYVIVNYSKLLSNVYTVNSLQLITVNNLHCKSFTKCKLLGNSLRALHVQIHIFKLAPKLPLAY